MEEGSDANRRGEDDGVPRPGFAVEDRQQRVIPELNSCAQQHIDNKTQSTKDCTK